MAEKTRLAQEEARRAEAEAQAELARVAEALRKIQRVKAKAEAEPKTEAEAKEAEKRRATAAAAGPPPALLEATVLDAAGGFGFQVQGTYKRPEPIPTQPPTQPPTQSPTQPAQTAQPAQPQPEGALPETRYGSDLVAAATRIQAHYRGRVVREELYWELMGYNEEYD